MMYKTNKKSIQGITLVALVITIIVMLIIAGVAINLTIDNNGLFGKSNTAGNKWNSAVENERSELQEWLDILGVEEPTTISTELPAGKGWDSNKVSVVVAQGTRKAPIPKGFTVSGIEGENTIKSGLVIYETRDADTTAEGFWTNTSKIDGKDYLTCQTTYNQYVWIPVDDINYMVMCKSNGKIADENGNKTCNLALQSDGTLKCITHNSTDLCGRLYATDCATTDEEPPKTYTTNMQFTEATRASQTWNTASDHEPNVLSSYDNDTNTKNLAIFTAQMMNDFTSMATSVAKYGGFYVSRYEAGENGESKRNQKVITASSNSAGNYIGVDKWYGLYSVLHREIALETSTIQSHMIYGSQYDQMINFIGTDAQIGHPGEVVKSQSLTGTKEIDKLKNIYDLEGNNLEWTAQAFSSSTRVFRGTSYGNANAGSFFPASSRAQNHPTNAYISYTSRASLYL